LGHASIHPSSASSIEHEIKRVPHAHAIVIPTSDKMRGHGSHTIASLWKDQLLGLLKETEPNH
jgi:homoserine O-acetyltransferase/O-succinyltransferase